MLISLHLPKTAGSSFRASIEEHFKDGVLRDYADYPINTPPFKRNASALRKCIMPDTRSVNTTCIHGHFLPIKYALVRNANFVTWMRDPVERLASHYHYWVRNYNPEACPPLHRRVVEENWSLERFCLAPELKNFYSQFLWGFPVEKFSFIGITEHYESEIQFFSNQFLGASLAVYNENINQDNIGNGYFSDSPSLRNKIEAYHKKDVKLYKHALSMRKKRLQRVASG